MHIECIVRGVCIKEGKILLAYLKEGEYYFLPGGHIEHAESIFHTLERELMEEAAITAHAKELVLTFEHAWQKKDRTVHEINFLVTFEIDGDQDVSSTEEHLEFHWVAIEELKNITFMPKEVLPTILRVRDGDSRSEFLSTLNAKS